MDLKTEITRFESNPEFIQIVPSAEPVVVVSLQVKIHDNKSLMNFCYPYRWLAELVSMPDIQERLQFGVTESTKEEQVKMQTNLKAISCDISASLGSTVLTIDEFINLQNGDLLVLDSRPNDESSIFVQDKLAFKGIIGRKEKFRAIQVTKILEEELENAI